MTTPSRVSGIRLDRISLVTRDAQSLMRFYSERLGMKLLRSDGHLHALGFDSEEPVLELVERETAMSRPGNAPGLFHVAYLYPTRAKLATALRKVVSSGWPLQGAADHGVSEAVYLVDPEGNGIELYTDRPKEEWPVQDGELRMVTEPLDLEALLAEGSANDAGLSDTTIGHVHLQVASLESAETFWVEKLGLDATQRSFPGALFVSAGGYHHHIGLNAWRSKGRSLPQGEWTGLRSMTLSVPDAGELSELRSRLENGRDQGADTITGEFETTTVYIQHQS